MQARYNETTTRVHRRPFTWGRREGRCGGGEAGKALASVSCSAPALILGSCLLGLDRDFTQHHLPAHPPKAPATPHCHLNPRVKRCHQVRSSLGTGSHPPLYRLSMDLGLGLNPRTQVVEKEGPCDLSQLLLRSWIQDDKRRLGRNNRALSSSWGTFGWTSWGTMSHVLSGSHCTGKPGHAAGSQCSQESMAGRQGGASTEEGT